MVTGPTIFCASQPAHAIACTACFTPQPARQILSFREIEKPLWGLHPGDVRIAKIAERVAQQGRENAGIGITDDQKVAIGMFQPVAQVTGLVADIALTGDIVRPSCSQTAFISGRRPSSRTCTL